MVLQTIVLWEGGPEGILSFKKAFPPADTTLKPEDVPEAACAMPRDMGCRTNAGVIVPDGSLATPFREYDREGDFLLQPSACWDCVRGFTPLSLCDWPGRTSAVLFTGGCNLACPTCHNARLAWEPETCPPVNRMQVMSRLLDRRRWISGVVVTGGEPTCCPDLIALLSELKAARLPVKLDSNGMLPEVLARVLELELADEIHVDVKGPYAMYPLLTGLPMEPEYFKKRLETVFELAHHQPGRFMFRTTLVPALTDGDVDDIRTLLPQGFDLRLQDYKKPAAADANAV